MTRIGGSNVAGIPVAMIVVGPLALVANAKAYFKTAEKKLGNPSG